MGLAIVCIIGNIVGKEKLLVSSFVSFSHNVFNNYPPLACLTFGMFCTG